MQEPSPSLEERIRAGTGMASSNTQDAKNNQKNNTILMQWNSVNQQREDTKTMLQQEKIRSNGKLGMPSQSHES